MIDSRPGRRPAARLVEIARTVVEVHRAAPCAVVAAAVRDGDGWLTATGSFGRLFWDDGAPPVEDDTPFDLASVTKPLTALALAKLERAGRISRREPMGDVVEEAKRTPSATVPLDLFAAHRAGLEAHRALFAPVQRGEPAPSRRACLEEAARAKRTDCAGDPPPDGFAPVYSDLGYLLLGEAVARRGGGDLDEVVAQLVTGPLGLRIGSARKLRQIDPAFDERVAPTEVVAWRGGCVRGVVHDENAWVFAGDASAGHAGLFGDARSVLGLGMAVLDALAGRSSWLGPDDLAPVLRPRPGGSHRAGFDSKSGDCPSAGSRFGPRTFGHLGFTGTSLWIDPDAEIVGVLLTNRVHPTRETDAIKRARPAVYDALWDAMLR